MLPRHAKNPDHQDHEPVNELAHRIVHRPRAIPSGEIGEDSCVALAGTYAGTPGAMNKLGLG